MGTSTYDVAVVGASVAGCTAATFFGRRGLSVALLERASDIDAYKKVCTHFILASATPTIRRLGIDGAIEAAGGLRNSAETMLPSGWVPHLIDEYGYNIRREKLDPMLRKLAQSTDGVDLMLGKPVKALVKDGGRVAGVETDDGPIRAKLVVAADGRHGKMGELAGVPATLKPHGRFFYFAYYKHLELASGKRSQMWFSRPDAAYCFPNDDDLTLVLAAPAKEKLPAWRTDLEKTFVEYIESFPRAPKLATGERVSDFLGMLELPNHSRPASAPGIAFVGDSALAADPLVGSGCGWAMQSAEWLVEAVAPALETGAPLDAALEGYRDKHAAELQAHHALICTLSMPREPSFLQRIVYDACTKDEELARAFTRVGARLDHPRTFFNVRTLARALWVSATRRRRLPLPPK